MLNLTQWALHRDDEKSLIVLDSFTGKATKWNRKSIDDRLFEGMRKMLHEAGRIAVRIPAIVQYKNGLSKPTQFDAYIERAEGSSQKRPMFIRDGIVISDVRSRLMRDVYAIVAIDDPPLSGFLGDAENPAHTEWSEETSHFKGKYVNGAATLRFIRNAVSDLCQMLAEAADDDDPDVKLYELRHEAQNRHDDYVHLLENRIVFTAPVQPPPYRPRRPEASAGTRTRRPAGPGL